MCARGGVTSLDISVFFRPQQVFGYGYGGGFRDPNSPNLAKGVLKADGDFDTTEQRNALGIIDIHVDDLLISGSGGFTGYISQIMKGESEVDIYRWGRRIWAWKLKK